MSDEKWTTKNIPDLTGKIIVVTGGNSGLGYESVKDFAQQGAEVILACRSVEKGNTAKKEIGTVKGEIVVMPLDLMDFASIKDFADRFKKQYNQLDVLLNNAGIMTTPYFLTKDGLEGQMGTNHFGHFALTGHLLESIKNTPKSRVVNVSSMAHKSGKMDFDNLLFENGAGYSPMKSYGRSKLANLLFTYELQRRLEENGINSISVSAHPGVSNTNLGRHLENKLLFKILKPLMLTFIQDQNMGALPQIRASVDMQVKGGEYYGPDGFNEMKGYPVRVKSNAASHNREDAKKLWMMSEQITGVSFTF
jgi:NAD(P)-dependent dehydrogenase (short-subunit alcohol dehydrogenase family)